MIIEAYLNGKKVCSGQATNANGVEMLDVAPFMRALGEEVYFDAGRNMACITTSGKEAILQDKSRMVRLISYIPDVTTMNGMPL